MVTTGAQEIDADFQDQCNAIYDEWREGQLPYQQAVERIRDLARGAASAQQFANQGIAALMLGIMQGYRANLDDSIHHFESARSHFDRAQLRERVISCILNIGEAYRLKGNFTRARRFFRTAYESARDIGKENTQAVALTNEGQMLISMDRYKEALETLETAHDLNQRYSTTTDRAERTRRASQCEIHYAFAAAYLGLNEPEKAWEHARLSLSLSDDLQLPIRVGFAYRAIAKVLTELGEAPDDSCDSDPDAYFKAAIDAFREVKAEGEMAKTIYAHGRSLARRDKRMAAARKLQQAMVIFTRLGMVDDAAKAAEAQLDVL